MSIQAALNADSMNSVPKIKEAIANADPFEANQMEQQTLSAMMNSPKPIINMSDDELEQFQTNLIALFKQHNWLTA